jgi:hypothetical protein
MREQIKLWLRRWAIRQVIKLVDRAEERLQQWQVSLRESIACREVARKTGGPGNVEVTAFTRSINTVKSLPRVSPRHRQRITAADFDARFNKPKEYLQ